MPIRIQKIFAALAALIGWVSLGLQLILVLDHRVVPAAMAVLRFFTYFTILTNLLAASMFTALALPRTRKSSWLSMPATITAVTAYMTVVAIVYNTVLRGLVELHGLNSVLNELHHVFLPLATLLFWLVFVPKKGLRWRSAFGWLIYPFAYIVWVILFGAWTGFYPYPFTNAAVLGYPRALANGLIILAGFLGVFYILIAAGRIKNK